MCIRDRSYSRKFQNKKEPDFTLYSKYYVGGEGFEPPKAHANGFTVRPGSPTPASAQNNAKIKASDKYIFIQTKIQIFEEFSIQKLFTSLT